MKALNRRYQVDFFVYTGDIPELMVWLQTQGRELIKDVIWKGNKMEAKLHDRDITFFNHFVVEDGRLFKMTEDQFRADYFPISWVTKEDIDTLSRYR